MSSSVSAIKMFAGIRPPSGWLFCEGQLLEKANYAALFDAIGTTYGADGEKFALPDFRGRGPIAAGTGRGIPTYHRGQVGGEASVKLNILQMPYHTHGTGTIQLNGKFGIMAAPKSGDTNDPKDAVLAHAEDPVYVDQTQARDIFEGGGAHSLTTRGTVEAQPSADLSHNNMQPYLAIRYIIKVF